MSQILIFGDSIAYGAWDKEGGWAERLKIFSNKKSIASKLEFYCAIYDLAVDGDTTENLLKRIEFEIRQRARGEKIILLFAIGSNDSEIINLTDTLKVAPKKFSQNIEKIISISKKYSLEIIFSGLLPVDELKVDPIPWAADRSYKNNFIKKYNDIIKSICKENKIHFIELFDKFKKVDYKKLLEDGVHPSTKGHEKIFQIVKDYLIKNKII